MSAGVSAGPRSSFGRRLAAFLIDGIMLGVIGEILDRILGRSAGGGLGLLISLVYFTYLFGSPSGQTAGMRALGIRVYDFSGQSPNGIGYVRGFLRWIGYYVSAIPCLLGFWWILWDKEKQGWHDKFASTVVVPVDRYPVAKWPG